VEASALQRPQSKLVKAVQITGDFDYDPLWEVALAGEDAAGNRTEPGDQFYSISSHAERRTLAGMVPMVKSDIVRFAILKRAVGRATIENLPSQPSIAIESGASGTAKPKL
jgi:hypothetical protein